MHRSPDIEGLLANVSVVLMAGSDEAVTSELARSLEALFEDVVVVASSASDAPPGEAAVRELTSALAGACEERVLIVAHDTPHPTPNLWLALTAWPEHDAVSPRPSPEATPLCSLYRRDAVLAAARDRLEGSEAGELQLGTTRREALQGVAAALDVQFIEGADLAALCQEET